MTVYIINYSGMGKEGSGKEGSEREKMDKFQVNTNILHSYFFMEKTGKGLSLQGIKNLNTKDAGQC